MKLSQLLSPRPIKRDVVLFSGTRSVAAPKTGRNWNDGTAELGSPSGNKPATFFAGYSRPWRIVAFRAPQLLGLVPRRNRRTARSIERRGILWRLGKFTLLTASSLRLFFGASPRKSEFLWTSTAGADVDELVRGISKTRPFTRDMLEEIVATSSRATWRAGQTHRALPGKKSRCEQAASAQGRLKGLGDRFCNSLWSYRKYQNAGCGRARTRLLQMRGAVCLL